MRPTLLVLFPCIVTACTDAPSPEPVPLLLDAAAVSVAYGDGHFVMLRNHPAALGFGALSIAVSADGEAWTEVSRELEHGAGVGGVAYEAGRFLVVASELVIAPSTERRASAFTSTDGMRWTRASVPPEDVGDVAGLAGTFVVVGDSGLATTTDGSAWSVVPGSSGRWWSPVVERVGDRIYAFGSGPSVFETADARVWAAADTGLSDVHAIGVIAGKTLGFGRYDCCFGEEPDGITHLVMTRVSNAWQFAETPQDHVQGMLDVGTHTIAATSAGLTTTVDGETFEIRASGSTLSRPTFATDGAGTVVVAGHDALVSHDFGASWLRIP